MGHLMTQYARIDFKRCYHRSVTVGIVEEHDVFVHFFSLYGAFLGIQCGAVRPQQARTPDSRTSADDDADIIDRSVAVGIDNGIGRDNGVEVIRQLFYQILFSQ